MFVRWGLQGTRLRGAKRPYTKNKLKCFYEGCGHDEDLVLHDVLPLLPHCDGLQQQGAHVGQLSNPGRSFSKLKNNTFICGNESENLVHKTRYYFQGYW